MRSDPVGRRVIEPGGEYGATLIGHRPPATGHRPPASLVWIVPVEQSRAVPQCILLTQARPWPTSYGSAAPVSTVSAGRAAFFSAMIRGDERSR